jgi:hypothetical protein
MHSWLLPPRSFVKGEAMLILRIVKNRERALENPNNSMSGMSLFGRPSAYVCVLRVQLKAAQFAMKGPNSFLEI